MLPERDEKGLKNEEVKLRGKGRKKRRKLKKEKRMDSYVTLEIDRRSVCDKEVETELGVEEVKGLAEVKEKKGLTGKVFSFVIWLYANVPNLSFF